MLIIVMNLIHNDNCCCYNPNGSLEDVWRFDTVVNGRCLLQQLHQ